MTINQILQALREASCDGVDTDAMWQNLVDCHTAMGCIPEASFYVRDWWQVNMKSVVTDWVCAQWFELPAERWEKKFADKHAADTEWRYVVKTHEMDIKESYYIQKHAEHDETGMPTVGISWLDICFICNKKSLAAGLEPVYFFNEERTPLTDSENFDGVHMYEDEAADGYRLPTKDEWVTACLAGREGQDTPWGNHSDFEDSFKALDPYVVCYENSKGKLQPVGTKLPNQWGLYDMLGNTFEFTSEEV
tara:strand:+ start:241 stop:987 length:747 start_codon:yes stop_codon:yes gene_type:complete